MVGTLCYSDSRLDPAASGKRIAGLIDESGFTDKKLSEIMGISVQSIHKWRHGKNFPDIENMYILSRILNVKVDDFLVPLMKMQIDFGELETAESRRRRLCFWMNWKKY